MSLDSATGTKAPATLPLQYVTIQVMPIVGGKLSVAMQATLLDEQELEFIGQDLANERVDTIEQALAVIRNNIAILQAA